MTIRRIFRWTVFLLAAVYVLRTFLFGSFENFAGPFRYLTIWALFASFFSASRMLAFEEGRSPKRWDGFVSMTSVVNAMVVFLYWRLFFADPSSVTQDGQLGAWYLELYMHGLGPLLQMIDAIFVHRSFTKFRAAVAWTFGVIGAYILWIELVVQRMNDDPLGTVTSGLPYPFLNNLEFDGRAIFYASNFAVALLFLACFAGLAWLVRHLSRAPVMH